MTRPDERAAAGALPTRAELLIAGVQLVSMDPAVGDADAIDVRVRDGEIAAVGHGLEATGETLDGRGMLLLPGFVETHWHLWNTLLRGTVGEASGRDYFAVKRALAPHFEVEDFYWSARLALAEAAAGGITTVHNWDHNVRAPADADANVGAHLDSGLRGRFSYGPPDSCDPACTNDLDDVRGLLERWTPEQLDGRLTFGMALRGPYRTPAAVYEAEWRTARELGLPITLHCDRCLRERDCRRCGLERLERLGLLGPDVQVVHAVHASPEDVAALARTGTRVSLSPLTELPMMGFPLLTELLEAGVPTSLSLDTLAAPTSADMLGLLRTVLAVECARTGAACITPRRLLQLATIDGARDLGLEHVTGSVTPGKRADLVLLRMDDLNLVPSGDPVEQLVGAAQVDNVDTVIADGRVLKRAGRLCGIDGAAVARIAQERRDALLARARAAGGWS